LENGAGPFPSVWIIFESRDDPDIARKVQIEVNDFLRRVKEGLI